MIAYTSEKKWKGKHGEGATENEKEISLIEFRDTIGLPLLG